MTDYQELKYLCESDSMKATIEKYGVAIIPGVLSDEQCQDMVNGIWSHFEHITQKWETPIDRQDTSTWMQYSKLYPIHSMLYQHWDVGHSQPVWNLRQNTDIVDIFSKFWNCKPEELLVSFDGLSFHLPPETTNKGWFRNNTWFHCDQSFIRPDFECLQSWITGLDIDEGDATLAFYESSNQLHEEFGKTFGITNNTDWHKLTKEQEQFYKDKCSLKKIKCPKGSLVLWDSRTIHCGVEASKNRPNPKCRSVVYLCYQPRSLATIRQLSKKQKAFRELRLTSHWPCKPKLFPKFPRTYGKELPVISSINTPQLTDLGKRLAGF